MSARSTVLCLVAVLVALPLPRAQEAPRGPNIVYVMADELGYYELSCLGNPNLRTPNIDALAAEGMRFTQMLAGSAVCAPTRACFLTGKHSGHTSVRSNGGGTPLRAEEATIGTLLKERGYATGGFGKWGCGGRGSTGVPELHGFDLFLGYYDQVHAHTYFPAYLVRNSEEVPLPGNHGGRSGQTYSATVIFDAALEFVREHAAERFFCYLPVTPPHGMFDIPDDDPAWAQFADAPWPEEARRYAAMVALLDRQVGELVALLRELGIERDTLVMFSGDNGGADYFASPRLPRGVHGANVDPRSGAEFRGHKGQLYEGGLRIPFIARWPGRIAPGTVSDHLCYFPDVLPTLAELAAARMPADVDGISFVPTLLGAEAVGRAQAEHDYLYWEIGGQTAVRAGDWKIYRARPAAGWELYDLAHDVGEARDLAAEQPERVAALAAFAAAAHEPVREGTFADTTLHERDRAAKWGGAQPDQPAAARVAWPTEGIVSPAEIRLVRASSQSDFNGKVATNAFDGDPSTLWHTRFRPDLATGPHELVLDLGTPRRLVGFRYLARQDNGWNGTVAACELSLGDDPDAFPAPVVSTTLRRTKDPQDVTFPATTARYVRFRALSEIQSGPWASAAELALLTSDRYRVRFLH
ncbi:MAG: sulfatase-like hydrolase/transferase [Planctomycetes bacterium]|nr:sulfatase-like hydrolase/transferase [Planctomycetota bacterium]